MITHDTWQRIKEIFESAQKLSGADRSDFLNQACGDDGSIREEVEALLTADASNDEFLSTPAYEFAASLIVETEFSAGQEIGRYTILCPLGSGGMGQIYLAEDAKLRRKIALKFISQQFATDPQRVRRFEQEALAASALNHPNICVIHELGITENNRHFIAMEYIQGITVRDQLSRGPLQVKQALNIAIQVATALSSAHASGIIHRDIKPENIMLRPDGYVKVLDFGLAKLTEIVRDQDQPGARSNVHTETGMLMGTVKYMSPEQLRDTKIDERTDIWSLGIVLYEMLTGSTPFEAPSSNESVAAILAPQPSALKFPEGIPKQLQGIIREALEKKREQRYQTVTKFAADLSQLEAGSKVSSPLVQGNEQLPQKIEPSGLFDRLKTQALNRTEFLLTGIRTHKTAALFTGVTSVLFLLLFLPPATRYVKNLITSPTQIEMISVTNAGTSICSAMSRDGNWVAHAEEKGGKQRLVLTNIATATSTDIVVASDVQYTGVSFTQDGNYLYFTRVENARGAFYRLALPGGVPVKIKDAVDSPVSFSPQQDRFAFVRVDNDTKIYSLVLSGIDGSNEQVLATREKGDAFSTYGLAWSPDGNLIICPVRSWSSGGFKMSLVAIHTKDGSVEPINNQSWFSILQIAWQDDMSGLVISARDQATNPFQLWRISYPGGVAHQLTRDLAEYRGVSLAGQEILTVRTEWFWELTIASAEKDFGQPSTIASGVGLNYGVTWAGNKRIVFSAMVQDSLNILRIDADGTNQVQLTTKSKANYSPAASSDGQVVVFSSDRTGNYDIWRMNVEDGGKLKQLTFTNANYYPSISPDNQWVAYDNQQPTQKGVWKVPLDGGQGIKLVDRHRMPGFSPDGQYIVARYDLDAGTKDTLIVSAGTGEILQKITIPYFDWQRVHWLPQNTLSYVDKTNGYPNIFTYDIATGKTKQLTNFNRNQIFSYAWSPDYKLLACQLGSKTSNVVKIRNDE